MEHFILQISRFSNCESNCAKPRTLLRPHFSKQLTLG